MLMTKAEKPERICSYLRVKCLKTLRGEQVNKILADTSTVSASKEEMWGFHRDLFSVELEPAFDCKQTAYEGSVARVSPHGSDVELIAVSLSADIGAEDDRLG
jgi:hypothetical protein